MPIPALIPVVASLAARFAPDIVHLIAGDQAGRVAKKVSDLAMAVTGADSIEEAQSRMEASPDIALQFRQQAMDERLEYERMMYEDRANARERDVKMREAGYHNWRADFLAFIVVAAIGGIVYLLSTTTDLSEMVFSALNMALGALLKMLGDVFAFEFGSSRGSKDKDKLSNQ